MTLTLASMRTRLRQMIGNLATTDDASDTLLTQHINSAYKDITNKFRFHRMRKLCDFDTIAGTRRYGIPTGAVEIYFVRNLSKNRRLELLGQRRAEELMLASSDGEVDPTELRAEPTKYVRTRDFIELHPTPDAVYTVRVFYKESVTELVDDTDEPVIPASWHHAVVMLARWYFYDQSGDMMKAEQALNAYNRWIADQPSEVDEEARNIDSGVELPTLRDHPRGRYSGRVYDPDSFNRGDW